MAHDISLTINDFFVMLVNKNKILNIVNKDFENNDNKGYSFSFSGDKHKNEQRLKLYQRMMKDWKIIYNDKENKYIITK